MEESAPPESQAPFWNKLTPEILGLVLPYLGKQDLLNSRLVSRAWNDESLKILQKSKFTQLLTESSMREYIQFTTPTNNLSPSNHRPFNIPFHLNFEINLKSGLPSIFPLCQIFGPNCVSTLTLTTDDTEMNFQDSARLIELVELCAPGLKTLDLTKFNFKNNFLQNQIIAFPNLKKLICNTSNCVSSGKDGPGLAYISIIENSPSLEDLTLTHPCDLEDWPLNFNQLKSLSLDKMVKPQNILDKILSSIPGRPVLRELCLRNVVSSDMLYEDGNEPVVYNILESFSHTLKSLTIRSLANLGNMRFPKLPYLDKLKLEYDYETDSQTDLNIDCDNNFSGETFPSLFCIDLPIGLIFRSHKNSKEFPNVIIALKLCASIFIGRKHLSDLQQLLPPPLNLVLINAGADDSVKYVLDHIVKSNWSKNIQRLEMIGFTEDFLGEVLDELKFSPRLVLEKCDGIWELALQEEFENVMRGRKIEFEETEVPPASIILARANQSDSIKMTNITTINLVATGRLGAPARHTHQGCCHSPYTRRTPTPALNLTGLGKHFPRLRTIQASESLFRQYDKSVLQGQIMEFKSIFPHVTVDVT